MNGFYFIRNFHLTVHPFAGILANILWRSKRGEVLAGQLISSILELMAKASPLPSQQIRFILNVKPYDV